MSNNFFDRESKIDNDDRLTIVSTVENISSVTKILLVLAEHLDHAGCDEIGAEMLEEFARMYAEHESENVPQTLNKELN